MSCGGGNHRATWTTSSSSADQPAPNVRCDCGAAPVVSIGAPSSVAPMSPLCRCGDPQADHVDLVFSCKALLNEGTTEERFCSCRQFQRGDEEQGVMAELAPFNSAATCPKCHFGEVETIYHEKVSSIFCRFHGFRYLYGEHLARVCQRCRCEWPEAVLSAQRGVGEQGAR